MKWILAVLVAALAGCSTTPKKESPSTGAVVPDVTAPSTIDYVALQTFLGLDRAPEELGYTERAFNTCDAGYGYSRSQNCRQEVFVVLHFRLLCRDSEGTISTILTESDVTPIAGRTVKWSLKGMTGTALTDGLGYGQIRTVSPRSQRRERARLAVGSEFLYMRANEITKIITPRPWCNP
ncbi:hypothetical protein [Bdellovibrio bacteriovorus]|uniref:Lipoprotein n=1 Tax=Bdellovibrio bacteriovorus TaxID=959 RepID=A0A1Z3N9Q0_BDEBC|nr:hypothetical protein [Bdellovibrio bacteriovorus]ASD64192.1 hypothetical protein B9G79_11760 [Bdellovibrio bacteriovorus]